MTNLKNGLGLGAVASKTAAKSVQEIEVQEKDGRSVGRNAKV